MFQKGPFHFLGGDMSYPPGAGVQQGECCLQKCGLQTATGEVLTAHAKV